MERKSFLEKLVRVSPALLGNDLIPVLTHFWFTGENVMAFNDQIAISVPCQTNFTAAVPGNTLMDLLKASKARELELTIADNNLNIKAASSKFKLGIMEKESFVFEMPKSDKDARLKIDFNRFLSCLDSCMRSVTKDTSVPEQLGVTLIAAGDQLMMFSTNNSTLSYGEVELKSKPKFDRVILSGTFCEQLLKLADPKDMNLEIHKDYALLEGIGYSLFGRLLEVEKPVDFVSILSHHCKEGYDKELIQIPSKLRLVLDRACIITDSKLGPAKTEIFTTDDGKMKFVSKSDRGEVYDSIMVGDHPKISVTVDPKFLKSGYGSFDRMLVTDICFIMAQDEKLYLVTVNNE